MRLKKLEISGFKSFPKNTVLEFPSAVTCVVGPNGSGKSNIKEAVQWVLGEQSMKSLRGKRGEDLIWNGSPISSGSRPEVPRLGKASVTLFFDNRDGKIPLDFDEVAIARKIFRDGTNEYYLNNSQVRLKDVVELIARMGLGETKHNIIGQGEVDHILLASTREKREMLEEALGLRVYQLKKNETERKLETTQNNVKQVESLLREISPHLKFLRAQVEKQKAREGLEKELRLLEKIYLALEKKEIGELTTEVESRKKPLLEKAEKIKEETDYIRKIIAEAEKKLIRESGAESGEEKRLNELENKRRELERELGRLEGRLEIEKEKMSHPKLRVVDTTYIQQEIKEYIAMIKAVLSEEKEGAALRSHLSILAKNLENLLLQIRRGAVEEKRTETESSVLKEISAEIKKNQTLIADLNKEAEEKRGLRRQEAQTFRDLQAQIREQDAALRRHQDEERDVSVALERLKFEEEKIKIRESAFRRALSEFGLKETSLEELGPPPEYQGQNEDLKRKIDRLRLKLEEIGGIDETVIREYSELDSRHVFLSKELEDLKKAHISLKELLKELDEHLKRNFKEGFAKIKEEFNKLFKIIFNGGRAGLELIKYSPRVAADETGEVLAEEEETREGIEISVDLPRKRIKGLAMLSGGERALSSIALLFAIVSINPPPFLILDETDAALDEANTQRYANILKELSRKTQLIIVTHNRETMKSAGVLYGVTMGDDGVSKLLSLKLEEAEMYTNR